MIVWLASRGFGGKSFMLAVLALTEATTLGAEVNVLGGSADQSENVVRYTERMIASPTFPAGALAGSDSRVQPLTKARISLANGGRLLALAASTRTTRGPHIPRLRIDEADEMPLRIFDAAMGQTMERGGIPAQTVVSSTHHYPDGTFTEVLKRASAAGWPVYEWCLDGDSAIMGVDRTIRMRDVRKGDRVYAYEHGRLIETVVTDAWQSGVRGTVVVGTDAGDVTCTREHRILTVDGWRRAGDLQPGDAVRAVRDPAGAGESEDRVTVAARFVSALHRTQAVSGVREADSTRVHPLLGLSRPGCSGGGAESARDYERVPEVQRKEECKIGGLHGVPSLASCGAQCQGRRRDGSGASASCACWEQQATAVVGRMCRFGVVRRIGNPLLGRAESGPLRGGLCGATCELGYRGKRALLAWPTRAAEARRAQAGRNRGPGDDPGCFVERPTPTVGAAIVRRVGVGPAIPVYDLTVETGESFVANGIVVHNCWRETMRTDANPGGWLDPAEVERKRGEVTAAMWDAEYDLQEPSVDGRAINTDAVEAAFSPEWGEWDGENGETITVEVPDPDAHYGTGTDWAKKKDWTIIVTFRVLSRGPLRVRCIAWQRMGRLPWPIMIGAHSARVTAYGGAALHDAGGVGDVAADYIEGDVPTGGVFLSGRVRYNVFSDYILAIEAGRVQYPRIDFAYREHKFATMDALFRSGDEFHAPDSFVAGALAYQAARLAAGGEKWQVYEDV